MKVDELSDSTMTDFESLHSRWPDPRRPGHVISPRYIEFRQLGVLGEVAYKQ